MTARRIPSVSSLSPVNSPERFSLDELRTHLHYDHRDADSIPFHYRQQFRSWDSRLGILHDSKRVFDQLAPGDYDVVIRTKESAGEMKILEYNHQGSTRLHHRSGRES